MKSRFQVYMDFRMAEDQVSSLNRIARQMEELADTQMERTMQRIGSSWTGENADEFLNKGDQLQDKIRRNASDIRKIATAIDRIATTTRDAELRAIQIAEENERRAAAAAKAAAEKAAAAKQ